MVTVGSNRGIRPDRPDLDLVLRQLRSTPLFADCTDAELAAVADRSQELRVAAGDVIARAATLVHEVPVLLDGYAGVQIDGGTAVVLGPGAVIGGPEALDGALHPMTVVAQTPVVARVISAPDFTTLVAGVPSLALALIRQLGGRTRTVLDELVCARQGSVTPGRGSLSARPVAWSSSVRPGPGRTPRRSATI